MAEIGLYMDHRQRFHVSRWGLTISVQSLEFWGAGVTRVNSAAGGAGA